MENLVQMEVISLLMQHIFYTKDDSVTKLVQNIVLEFLESNLENLIEDAVRNKTTIKESLIKVLAILF